MFLSENLIEAQVTIVTDNHLTFECWYKGQPSTVNWDKQVSLEKSQGQLTRNNGICPSFSTW